MDWEDVVHRLLAWTLVSAMASLTFILAVAGWKLATSDAGKCAPAKPAIHRVVV